MLAHNWYSVNYQLVVRKTPVISLRSTSWARVKSDRDWGWHYRNIVGSNIERTVYRYRFFWWRWTSNYDTYWYLMHDFNIDSSGSSNYFWEKHARYYQLQAYGVFLK